MRTKSAPFLKGKPKKADEAGTVEEIEKSKTVRVKAKSKKGKILETNLIGQGEYKQGEYKFQKYKWKKKKISFKH